MLSGLPSMALKGHTTPCLVARVHLVVVEYLKRIDQNGLNNADLPTGIGNVAAGTGTHESRSSDACQLP